MYNIAFPELNLYFNIDKIAINIFGIAIHWYGIIIVAGILFCLFLLKKNKKASVKYDAIEEYLLYALPVAIICARAYYVIFSWDYYKNNLTEILKIWNGGLAIYGGIIGAIIVAMVFCKKKKIYFFDLLDTCVPYLALGQAIGRWGNFVNREAYGAITNSFFRMEILDGTGKYISVHPTFLYESVGLIILFFILRLKKSKFSGNKTAIYFCGYGILRFFIEYLRIDSLMFLGIKVSMLVSLMMVVLGITVFFIKNNLNYFKDHNK